MSTTLRIAGSGKSFLTAILRRQSWFSRTSFLNPDDIAARLGDPGELEVILQAAREAEAQRSIGWPNAAALPSRLFFPLLTRSHSCGVHGTPVIAFVYFF